MAMFFKKDPLPADWPSASHNKCNNASCTYPNLPQPAPGRYNCRGCESGTYVVTLRVAKEVDARCRRVFDEEKQNKLKMQQEEIAKKKAEEAKKRELARQAEQQRAAVERQRKDAAIQAATRQRRADVAQKHRAREEQEREAAAQQRAFLEQKCREEAAHQQRALLEQQRREEAAQQERAVLEQQRRDEAAYHQRSRERVAQHIRALETQRTMKEVIEMGDSMWVDYERRLETQRALEQGSQMGESSYQGPNLYECQTSPRTEARRAKLAERSDASLGRRGAYRRQNSAGDSSHGHGVSRAASPTQGGYACVQHRTAAYYAHSAGVERPGYF